MEPTETLAWLERAFSSIHVLIAYLDTTFNFIWVNQAYANADNRTPDFFKGRNHFAVYPDPENEAIFRRVLETGESFFAHEKPFEYPQDQMRGTTYWDWALVPVLSDGGSIEGLVFVLIDVTDKVQSKRRLADAAAYARGLVEANPDPFMAIDTLERITDANTAAEEMFGYSRSDTIGTRFTDYCKDPDKAVAGYRLVLAEGTVRDYPLEITHRDGHPIPTLMNATLHCDANGKVVGIIVTARDISERLAQERERRRLYEDLLASVTELRRREALMTRAERLAGVGYWYVNLMDDSITWSNQTYRLFGVDPATSPRDAPDFRRYVRQDDLPIIAHAQQAALADAGLYDAEFRIVRADGEERLMHAQGDLERDPTGRPIRLFGVVRDITDTRRKEALLRERFRLMAEYINDVVWVSTADNAELFYINPAYEKIWGQPRDALYANPNLFFEALHPEDRERVHEQLITHGGAEWEMEYRICRPGQTERWIHDRRFALLGDKGEPDLIVGVASDVTALKTAEEALKQTVASLKQANRQLADLSFKDPLTGVANRRFLEDYIGREWPRERRHGHDISLIMVDVDKFKDFNDVYGHPHGDDCLRRIAREISVHIHRPTDVVARVGGEEFAVLLPETGLRSAERLAERLRESISGLAIPHERSGVAPVVTVSLGVAAVNPRASEFRTLLDRADRALYRAKDAGRNRVEAWQLH